MSKGVPAKIISIIVGLGCLLAAGWFGAKLQYGKQMEQQQAEAEKLQKSLEQLQKINAQYPVDWQAMEAIAETKNVEEENKSIRATHNFLDEVYSGLLEAKKRKVPSKTYFIEQGKASELKQKLQGFMKIMRSRLSKEPELESGDLLNLDSLSHKDQRMSWEEHYFGNVTVSRAKERLTTIKEEMTMMEIRCRK